jgi:hypothetical protein
LGIGGLGFTRAIVDMEDWSDVILLPRRFVNRETLAAILGRLGLGHPYELYDVCCHRELRANGLVWGSEYSPNDRHSPRLSIVYCINWSLLVRRRGDGVYDTTIQLVAKGDFNSEYEHRRINRTIRVILPINSNGIFPGLWRGSWLKVCSGPEFKDHLPKPVSFAALDGLESAKRCPYAWFGLSPSVE